MFLVSRSECATMWRMRQVKLTIRLDEGLDAILTKVSRQSGRSRSEVAREALRCHLQMAQFDELRRRVTPFARARGYLTDEDVFADIS